MALEAKTKFVRRDGERGVELFTFEEVSRIEVVDSHTYQTNVHREYSYGDSAHGGLLLALLLKTISLHFATTHSSLHQPNTISLHNEFLRTCSTGLIAITIRDVRIGKTTSTIHATILQNKIERCVCYATQSGPLATRNTLSIPINYTPTSALPPINFASVLSGTDAHWFRYDVGRDPSTPNHTLCNVIFAMQRHPPRNPSTLRSTTTWITPRIPSETWTTPTLGLVLDHAVPPIENFFPNAPHNSFTMPARALQNEKQGLSSYDHPFWSSPRYYPTVSMSIEIKRPLPAEGAKWLLLVQRTKACVDGRFDVEAEVWDPEGKLVAIAQSLWFVVDLRGLQEGAKRVEEAGRKGIRGTYDGDGSRGGKEKKQSKI